MPANYVLQDERVPLPTDSVSTSYSISPERQLIVRCAGSYDWNQELTSPMIRLLATHWERVFTTRIPTLVKSYVRIAKDAMLAFHQTVTAQAGAARAAHMSLLSGQLTTHGDALQAICNEVIEYINATQREINREFTPGVQEVMVDAYNYCTNERGSGSFMRMKRFMEEHVDRHKRNMFERSVNSIKAKLNQMVKDVEDLLDESTARLYGEISRDYHSVFGGEAQDFSGGTSRAVREVKEKVRQALVDFERPFKVVIGLEAEPKAEPKEEDLDGEGINREGANGDGADNQIQGDADSARSKTVVKDEVMDDDGPNNNDKDLEEPGPSNNHKNSGEPSSKNRSASPTPALGTRSRTRGVVKKEPLGEAGPSNNRHGPVHTQGDDLDEFPPEADNADDSDFAPNGDGDQQMRDGSGGGDDDDYMED
jgi:hypothetical protein